MRKQGPVIAALLALAGAFVASPVVGQSIARVTLDKPDATFAEPVSSIRGLRELADGRLIVTDMIEEAIKLLDFKSGTVQEIGRQGSGPGEYGMPGELFGLSADTTWMLDMANRHFMVIQPGGSIADNTISLTAGSNFPVLPRGADRQGRVYYDLSGIMAPGMESIATSGRAPLVRLDPRTGKSDTLGTVNFPPIAIPGGRVAPGEVRISIGGGGGPYAPRDAYDVTPDGRVAIARYQDYHLEWLGGPRPIVGPTVTYDPVKIGRGEKEAWAERQTQGIAVMMVNGQRRTMRPPKPNIDEQTWPDVMPPFTGQVVVTPEGEAWVQRSQPARIKTPLFDVFDGSGRPVKQVALPEGRRLVGMGRGVLYAVRTDENDLQWIERYRR